MRVLFPQEIYDETDRLLPYMEFDQKEGWHGVPRSAYEYLGTSK